jgi:RNA polymerase sigma factor (sigma-70 family)
MTPPADDPAASDPPGPRTGGGGFATTRWSMVVAAGADSTPEGRAALESLFSAYWAPLYTFARRSGADREEAQDLVQGFLAELLEKDRLRQADRNRGRFRTFLLAAFRHHWSHERERARALKRGGGRAPLPLDFDSGENLYLAEPADDRTPERLFDRRWALTVLAAAIERVQDDHARAGRTDLFEALRGTIGAGGDDAGWAAVADRLGMTEGAVKVAAHRLRRRYREVLRDIIAETVADPSEVDDEIRHLMASLAG